MLFNLIQCYSNYLPCIKNPGACCFKCGSVRDKISKHSVFLWATKTVKEMIKNRAACEFQIKSKLNYNYIELNWKRWKPSN